jgi:hypothetical protein
MCVVGVAVYSKPQTWQMISLIAVTEDVPVFVGRYELEM